MNYLTLIIVGLAGVALGYYFARTSARKISKQKRKKEKNKGRVLEFLHQNGKIKNNDVEILLGVSDSTAERYLDELEKERKIKQHGKIGRSVFYTTTPLAGRGSNESS